MYLSFIIISSYTMLMMESCCWMSAGKSCFTLPYCWVESVTINTKGLLLLHWMYFLRIYNHSLECKVFNKLLNLYFLIYSHLLSILKLFPPKSKLDKTLIIIHTTWFLPTIQSLNKIMKSQYMSWTDQHLKLWVSVQNTPKAGPAPAYVM